MRILAGLVVVFALQGGAAGPAAVWTKTYLSAEPSGWRHPVSVALSPSAACTAVAHNGAVTVFDISGEERWTWNYARANRFIQPAALALSPSCDAVAVVGRSEYKFTWLAQRAGGARALATTSTPMGAAFDRSGTHLAIGTAGGDVHLFTLTGNVQWKTTFKNCCVVQQLEFSDDGQFVLVRERGVGVLRLDGAVVWSAREGGMAASRDLNTFVGWSQPPHGPGIGSLIALDGHGVALWSSRRFSSTVGAIVSRAGDRIAAWVNQNQKPVEEDGYRTDHPRSLQVLTRSGDLVATVSVKEGTLLSFSPDATRLLLQTRTAIEEVDLEGRVSRRIRLEQQEVWPTVIVADDYSGVLVVQGRSPARVQWFALR